MARKPRFGLPGIPQHVIQRGNNREPCFYGDEDYSRYLDDLKEALTKNDCRLHAYVLMANHVHLLLTPMSEYGVSHLMQDLGRKYVRYVKLKGPGSIYPPTTTKVTAPPMPRRPRTHLNEVPLHIVQRGHNREPRVFADEDYFTYLHWLNEALREANCRLHAYALMTNHIHLLLTPQNAKDVPKLLISLGRRYVQYINKTYRRTGTLWDSRYKSSLIQAETYWTAPTSTDPNLGT